MLVKKWRIKIAMSNRNYYRFVKTVWWRWFANCGVNARSLVPKFVVAFSCPSLFSILSIVSSTIIIEKPRRGLSSAIMLHGQLKCAVGY